MPVQTISKGLIVVTGSNGFIGSALINRLAETYSGIGLDIAFSTIAPKTYECVCMDITSEKSIRSAFERILFAYGNKITSVVHLAAYYDFSGKPSPLYKKINVEGTERFLNVLQEFEVEQFIFSGSLLVYKPVLPGEKIIEESLLEPQWSYPESKVETEKILFLRRGKIPVLDLRIAGIYNDAGNSLPIVNHIKRIYEKQISSHFFPGNTTHGSPFLHLDDLVEVIGRAIEKRKELPSEIIINLGEPETMSYIELQKTIGKLLYNKEWKTYTIPKILAKAGAWAQNFLNDEFIKPWMIDMADDHMELDITKAKKILEWEPNFSLRQTLPKIIQSLKADPESWYKKNKIEK